VFARGGEGAVAGVSRGKLAQCLVNYDCLLFEERTKFLTYFSKSLINLILLFFLRPCGAVRRQNFIFCVAWVRNSPKFLEQTEQYRCIQKRIESVDYKESSLCRSTGGEDESRLWSCRSWKLYWPRFSTNLYVQRVIRFDLHCYHIMRDNAI
jgi:hypothetical protein